MFQGVPLSPFLFNLAINPLLAYLSMSTDCGIYVFWSDPTDDSPVGWYRARVTSYHCDGSCCLHYDNGDVEQSVDLHVVEWCYAGHF